MSLIGSVLLSKTVGALGGGLAPCWAVPLMVLGCFSAWMRSLLVATVSDALP